MPDTNCNLERLKARIAEGCESYSPVWLSDVVARLDAAERERDELRAALQFYAYREHWMGITEDAEARTLLVGASGPSMDGYSVAERALGKADG